jgi:hypothetical protein
MKYLRVLSNVPDLYSMVTIPTSSTIDTMTKVVGRIKLWHDSSLETGPHFVSPQDHDVTNRIQSRQTRLEIPIFGSNFWDPHCKWNSDSVFDSKDSGRKIFFEF